MSGTQGETRRRGRRALLAAALLAASALPGPALAAGSGKPPAFVFVPPEPGIPRDLEGGGTRKATEAEGAALKLLVPSGGGLTVSGHPTLYWYAAAPFDGTVKLSLTPARQRKPLIETSRRVRLAPGMRVLSTAHFGVELKRGEVYRWTVTLEPASGGEASTATSFVLVRAPREAGLGRNPSLDELAKKGVWYDALDAGVAAWREGDPSGLTAMMDYLGIPEAATHP